MVGKGWHNRVQRILSFSLFAQFASIAYGHDASLSKSNPQVTRYRGEYEGSGELEMQIKEGNASLAVACDRRV